MTPAKKKMPAKGAKKAAAKAVKGKKKPAAAKKAVKSVKKMVKTVAKKVVKSAKKAAPKKALKGKKAAAATKILKKAVKSMTKKPAPAKTSTRGTKATPAKSKAAPKSKTPPLSQPSVPAHRILPMRPMPPVIAGDRSKPLGIITHFYDRASVGVLRIAQPLRIGDTIRVERGDITFRQKVQSMRVMGKPVRNAKAHADIAVKMEHPAHEGARVYKEG